MTKDLYNIKSIRERPHSRRSMNNRLHKGDNQQLKEVDFFFVIRVIQIKPSHKIGYYEKSRQCSLGESVEQAEPSYTAGEGAQSYSYFGTVGAVTQKLSWN